MSVAVESKPFVMPRPRVGQFVNWYVQGDKTQPPRLASVISVANMAIECILVADISTVRWKQAARHVDDPFIAETKGQCVADAVLGGWDFTDDQKEQAQYRNQVEDQLRFITDRLASIEVALGKAGADVKNVDEIDLLRAEAEKLGLEVDKRWNASTLNARIKAARESGPF